MKKALLMMCLPLWFSACSTAPVAVSAVADASVQIQNHDTTEAKPSNTELLICHELSGCLGNDGRHYMMNSSMEKHIPDMTNTCPWHWHHAIPQDTASSCVYGDCVLPGADNVVPISTASDRPSPFLCDAPSCECGIVPPVVCHRNEVCIDEQKLCKPLDLSQHCPLNNQAADVPFDTRQCMGGNLICKGIDSLPMRLPNAIDTWQCRNVPSLPDSQKQTPGQKGQYKAWVCAQSEGCACKDNRILEGEICV